MSTGPDTTFRMVMMKRRYGHLADDELVYHPQRIAHVNALAATRGGPFVHAMLVAAHVHATVPALAPMPGLSPPILTMGNHIRQARITALTRYAQAVDIVHDISRMPVPEDDPDAPSNCDPHHAAEAVLRRLTVACGIAGMVPPDVLDRLATEVHARIRRMEQDRTRTSSLLDALKGLATKKS